MTELADLKARILANPEARAEYDAQAPEFELARELITARSRAGLTQSELAERMHTTQSTIARLEENRGLSPIFCDQSLPSNPQVRACGPIHTLHSTQNPGLTEQFLQARLGLNWAIQRLLKRLPLVVVQHKVTTICQCLVGRDHPGIEQEFTDVLMARTRSLLQQLLDRAAGADIDPFGFGEIQGAHGNPHVLKLPP